jgi:hypothetical protein
MAVIGRIPTLAQKTLTGSSMLACSRNNASDRQTVINIITKKLIAMGLAR